jgi:hypothetical protein
MGQAIVCAHLYSLRGEIFGPIEKTINPPFVIE